MTNRVFLFSSAAIQIIHEVVDQTNSYLKHDVSFLSVFCVHLNLGDTMPLHLRTRQNTQFMICTLFVFAKELFFSIQLLSVDCIMHMVASLLLYSFIFINLCQARKDI